MPRERTDIDYPAEECWQCCVWWSAGSSLRISGFVSWIPSKSILDFNSSEKLQPPKSKNRVQVLLVGKSQGALRWLLERSDIIVSSTYMKSRQLTHARIFCLSNQGCQLSGWTTVGNEIEESREFAGFCISRTDARIPAACSKRIVTLRNKKMTASSDFSQ